MNANNLVRSIFGFSRVNISPLVDAVEVAYQLMFVDRRSRSSINLTSEIYSPVAQKRQTAKDSSVSRQILRLCGRCLDLIEQNEYLLDKLIGKHGQALEGPSDVIFLLACYLKYEKSFHEVLELEPALAF